MEESAIKEIQAALAKGDRAAVEKGVRTALGQGASIRDILDKALISGMEAIGAKFKRNEVFIPEVLIAAKAMHAGLAIVEPQFVKCGIKYTGKVVIGTVKGDLHDIGKNIVSMMFKGACLEVDDFGIDVPPARFVEAVKKGGVDIVAMSSLLTTSMGSMRDTVKALSDSGLREKVRIIVGGAPVTREFADSIGADGYAKDAASAVDLARSLIGR